MSFDTVTWRGRFGPIDLNVAPDTFRPSTVSRLLADAMEIEPDSIVVDAGCGSGILAIIAAKLGAGKVHGVDAAEGTVAVATANAAAHGVADKTVFYQGDLFGPLPDDLEIDVVIGDVSGIPDEIANESGWFPSGLSGGPTGAELPMRMLQEAKRRLKRGGRMLLPTGSLQDEGSILETAKSVFGSIRQLSEKPIPLPGALAQQPAVMRMVKEKVVNLTQRGSRFVWTARVWEVTA